MTRRAQHFIAANALSPVVYASVIGRGGQGAVYRLANDMAFTLTADDCRALTLAGAEPRWARVA